MSQVRKLLKENIYFLIRFLISFYIFSVHHHVNFIVRIFEIILIMFLLAYTDLNMLNNFLYPFLLPWQLVKFSFQLVLFNRYYTIPTQLLLVVCLLCHRQFCLYFLLRLLFLRKLCQVLHKGFSPNQLS